MVGQFQIADRYEVLEPLGEGGMGVVYRAFDSKTKGYVAIKTIRDSSESGAVEMFAREWGILAGIAHPNIVDIRDVGEIDDQGGKKPFFVMPLLPGHTLAALIQSSSQRLTVERVADIICQACRGLHAAHEHGLVHRDIKPGNIFVMDDDTVKIIDFGIAHLPGTKSVTGLRGTWQYMAPEQVDLKPASALSDVFSLGVVCYEALTGQRPFARKTPADTAEAIRRHIPPPISEVNPAVSQLVSMVIHKAMAKQPIHRFSSARDFGETLQKAQLNQPLERFDRARIQPRIERAKQAFAAGDYVFSSEILTEVEAEGHIDREITLLRVQIEQAARRNKVRQLLEGAKARVEQEEMPLALEKLQEVLEIDPDNAEALAIRTSLEKQRSERQIEGWLDLARRHLEQHDFAEARQAVNEVLKVRPADTLAAGLLEEIGGREQESLRIRTEKEQLYGKAVDAYQNGEISGALSKLERILELGRQTPDAAVPERDAIYQGFFNQVRSDRDAIHSAYEECRRHFGENNFGRALEVCDEALTRYPGDALLQALRLEAVERQRQELSAYIAEIGQRIDAEADLDRKVNILKEACDRFPHEQQFQQLLKLTRERRDLILSIVAKARQYEDKNQFTEAAGQWEILRSIYPKFPGIDFEVGQLRRRREQQAKEEAKARLIEQIDRALAAAGFAQAHELCVSALAEYPQDQELAALDRLANQGMDRATEAKKLVAEAQEIAAGGRFEEAATALRRAAQLNGRDPSVREALVDALVEQARLALDEDWRKAEPLVDEAGELDGAHTGVRRLRSLVTESKRKETVSQCLAEAREQQAAGNLEAALRKIDRGLAMYPGEVRLAQLQATLHGSLQDQRRRLERNQDAESLRQLLRQLTQPADETDFSPVLAQSQAILRKYPDDPEIGTVAAEIQQRTSRMPREFVAPPTGAGNGGPPPAIEDLDSNSNPLSGLEGALAAYSAGPVSPVLPGADAEGAPPIRGSFSRWHWAAIAAMAVIASAAIVFSPGRPAPKPVAAAAPAAKPTKIGVQLSVTPPDAVVQVNGQARAGALDLDPGAVYEVVASRTGYQTLERHAFRPDQDWRFVLDPELVRIRLGASEKTGTASIDGGEIGNLHDGALPETQWAPDQQEHTLSLEGGRGRVFSFSFRAEPGREPGVGPLKTRDLVVVTSLGGEATVYAGTPGLRVNLAGESPRAVPPEGLRLTGLTAGAHELIFDGKEGSKLIFETGNAPSLAVAMNSNSGQALLYVTAEPDSARMFVDGQEIRPASRGKWWVQRKPGKYKFRFSASGYEDTEESIDLPAGQNPQRRFALRPKPSLASLTVLGGTPGADLLVDGTRMATLDAAGAARLDGIAPGQRRIGFRKEFFEPQTALVRTFAPGQTTVFQNEAKLKEFGGLQFQVAPPEAQVAFRRADQRESKAARPGDVARAPEGRYSVTVQAEGYTARTLADVAVTAGKITSVDVKLARLSRKVEAPAAAAPPATPGLFEWPNRLEQTGDWWHGKGSGYLFLKPGIHRVTFSFANPGKGLFGRSKKVEWVAHYVSERDKVVYELDEGKLVRRATVNGVEGKAQRVAHKLGAAPESYTISLTVEPGKIAVSAGGEVLDAYGAESEDLTSGRIGIRANTQFSIK